jgi:hypothetical protein
VLTFGLPAVRKAGFNWRVTFTLKPGARHCRAFSLSGYPRRQDRTAFGAMRSRGRAVALGGVLAQAKKACPL